MKKLFVFLSIVFTIQASAQLTYQLKVVDNQQRGINGLQILLKETSTKEKVKLRTDEGGNILFRVLQFWIWFVSNVHIPFSNSTGQ